MKKRTDKLDKFFGIVIFIVGVLILILSVYNIKLFIDYVYNAMYVKAIFSAVGEIVFLPCGALGFMAGAILIGD